jgi:hypothetical protein
MARREPTTISPVEGYFSLRALSRYSGLSVRRLRDYLTDGNTPLPHYRVGGKILVSRSEFDDWVCQFKSTSPSGGTMNALLDDVMRDLAA